jgi:hypothetical protein
LIAAIAMLVGLPNCIPPAHAETVTLKADLKGTNEVPPNASPASGKAEATFNTETRVLTWTVTYADLTGPAMGAHFHGPSEAGKNAGIVLPFKTVQIKFFQNETTRQPGEPSSGVPSRKLFAVSLHSSELLCDIGLLRYRRHVRVACRR